MYNDVYKTKARPLLLLGESYLRSATILFEEGQYRDALPFLQAAAQYFIKSKRLLKIREIDAGIVKEIEKIVITVEENQRVFPQNKIDDLGRSLAVVTSSRNVIKKRIRKNLYTSILKKFFKCK